MALAVPPLVPVRSPVSQRSGASPASSPAASVVEDVRVQLRKTLLDGRNRDGGWGYSVGHRSRLEPTSWALIALAHVDDEAIDVGPLVRWPQHDGWLVDVAGVAPNITFNAIAALTLAQSVAGKAVHGTLMERLLRVHGETLPQASEFRQNNRLAAWSWIEGTISWVEPTAWCLLASKKFRGAPGQLLQDRLAEGEAFLADRACAGGGWNYGNPNVYGTDLVPHVPTTAIALLALQDRGTHPVVVAGLQRLERDVDSEQSPLALALSMMALRRYGVATAPIESMLVHALTERQRHADGSENLHASALALCALSEGDRPLGTLTL
jgi:hypothetical protein